MKGFKWILLFTIVANAAIVLRLVAISQAGVSSLVNMNSIQNGDIVLRDSKSLIGSQFKMMSQHDKKFSHAGIIRKENGTAFVYHMANEKGQSGLLKTNLCDFVNTKVCRSYEIIRYPLKDSKRIQLLHQIDLLVKDKIHFFTYK